MASIAPARRLLAGALVAGLSLTTVACSDGPDGGDSGANDGAAPTSSPAAEDNTTSGESAGGDETTTAGAEAEGDGSTGAEAETVELQTADGNTVLVPATFADGVSQRESEWGQPQAVQQSGEILIATFDSGDRLVFSEETGAVELVGMIGQAWDDHGGAEAEVGLPTEAEEEIDNGWTQNFQNGVITYTDDGTGAYEAHIEQN